MNNNQYPEYGNVSKEVGQYLANIEKVHRSAGIGNTAFVIKKQNELYDKLSEKGKSEVEALKKKLWGKNAI